MMSVIGWFLVGMFIWLCVTVMQALENRLTPEQAQDEPQRRSSKRRQKKKWWDDLGLDELTGGSSRDDEIEARDEEIRDLKQRIEVLEAIVTDRRYSWDQEFRNGRS